MDITVASFVCLDVETLTWLISLNILLETPIWMIRLFIVLFVSINNYDDDQTYFYVFCCWCYYRCIYQWWRVCIFTKTYVPKIPALILIHNSKYVPPLLSPNKRMGVGTGLPWAGLAPKAELRHINCDTEIRTAVAQSDGHRAFSCAGHAAWNCLPQLLKSLVNSGTFKRHLKPYFYARVFVS